ncbi:hypothetical protein Tco_0699123, partial [Tanacetum coccineum]
MLPYSILSLPDDRVLLSTVIGVEECLVLPSYIDENEEPEEEKEEYEEEEPQEEEDMEVDVEEEETELKLIFPYVEADPLNPPPPTSDLEFEDVVEVEDTVKLEDEIVSNSVHEVGESSTATFFQEDGDSLLPSFMRRDINSLFSQIASLTRQVCGYETAHALVEKKGKAKDKYYHKLIADLGNEVRCSVVEKEAILEDIIKDFGNTEERVECKKLKKELEDTKSSNTLLRFVTCNPTIFHGIEGDVKLLRWFEKTEMVFGIRLRTVNRIPWTEMKQMMTAKFCPSEEVQRMEHELWNLK